MIIRKLYSFENAHILRSCSSIRCKSAIHGHSYKCEVLLSSNFLDNGDMVYDFGLMKLGIKTMIDSFDHAITINKFDDKEFIKDLKKYSPRWVEIPFNPSAEQLSRIFFVLIDRIINLSIFKNNEKEITLNSIIIHETSTGYAQCFKEDAFNKSMGEINLFDINFSNEIMKDWEDKEIFDKIRNNKFLEFPKDVR